VTARITATSARAGSTLSRVEGALGAARIPRSKRGPNRHAGLRDAERRLYVWILDRYASHGRPSSAETDAAAARLGIDPAEAWDALAREDLVHLGSDGEIAVAYPFSGRPTAHRVRLPNGNAVFAMCAIDALGMAPMLDEPVEIMSTDPLSGDEILVRLAPDATAAWEPASAVVVAGALDPEGNACARCCAVLNFFASVETAERWLEGHQEVRGLTISMTDAISAGEAVFEGILDAR
jgi:hypothetical protein